LLDWLSVNNGLPTLEEIVKAYKNLYNGSPLDDDEKEVMNWFVMRVMPIVHVGSQAKNNWHPFAFVGGSPPLYLTMVTSSNESFGLFLLTHYRTPPPPSNKKIFKLGSKTVKEEKQDDKDDNDAKEENEREDDATEEDITNNAEAKKRKQQFKKKIDIKQGKKDYKKWMGIIKRIRNSEGEKGIDCMDQNLCKMIVEYGKKLLKEGIDLTMSATIDVVHVPGSDDDIDYIDLDTVGTSVGM